MSYPTTKLLKKVLNIDAVGYKVHGENLIINVKDGKREYTKKVNLFEFSFMLREWSIKEGYGIHISRDCVDVYYRMMLVNQICSLDDFSPFNMVKASEWILNDKEQK